MGMRQQNARGFTLVELAIAIVIIGLLATGILKGRELFGNAQVTAAITAQDDIRKALNVFRESYYAYPGDVMTPSSTLNNCSGPICGRAGNGDGLIGMSVEMATPMTAIFVGTAMPPNTENASAWAQLAAAEIMHKTLPEPNAIDAGQSHPAAPGGGVFHLLYNGAGLGNKVGSAIAFASGHYLIQTTNAQVDSTNFRDNAVLPARVMERLDKKIDDGMPFTGNVFGIGSASGQLCASGPGAGSTYDPTGMCNAAFRITD